MKYNPKKIEKKWQKKWEEDGTFRDYSRKEKFYALDMFPYPSGAGLHVGHPKGYIATDVVARFEQLCGKSVLHPMGWDAFGLPAENYALKNKVHPRVAVEENIKTFKEQMAKIGFTYDWDREINTTDPGYYKWTQWIFLQMFKKGLAYESNEPINWCPSCKTGLANEDLEDGKCERCGSEVEQKPMRQWVLKMTDYADRLLEDLDTEDLDWEKQIIDQQKNWIGRSYGAEVDFSIVIASQAKQSSDEIAASFHKNETPCDDGNGVRVFTTRVDTIFGCTYVVLAPEHELIKKFKSPAFAQKLRRGRQISNWDEVEKYIEQAKKKTTMERTELAKEKTGVKLEGVEAINPFNGEKVPVFVADYVLGSYGTGAVMAVPAHDERDWEFAKKYDLPIKQSVAQQIGERKKISIFRRTAYGLIFNGEGQVLLQEIQDEEHGKRANKYLLPGGGIEEGEGEVEGLIREIAEETGYTDIEIEEKIGSIESNFFAPIKKQKRRMFASIYRVSLVSKEQQRVQWDEEERRLGMEHKWVSLNEMAEKFQMNNIDVGFAEIVRRYIEKDFCFTEDGILVDSGEFSGLSSKEAREKMTAWLEKTGNGKKQVNYKMRDWVFSRQRYWGEPIPIIHCEKCGPVAVPEDELPVKLPEVESYEPTGTGESPLAGIEEWVHTKCPKCGGSAKRETNTMPQWAGSSWYYLRYIDPKNNKELVGKDKEKEWMPVDLYVGGAEHATRHLLYARFWHKFLYDIGVVSTKEPFKRLVHVGLINAEDGRKMSKRWNNVINPDDVIAEFGADSLRLYEMFMGPFTQNIAWSTDGVSGVRRFLEKTWRLQGKLTTNNQQPTTDTILENLLHKTIKKVTQDIEAFRFNTAISTLMILVNAMESQTNDLRQTTYDLLLILLSPFAPHIAEELWEKMGHKESIFLEKWPMWDENLIKDETITMVVQVNGKVRDKMEVPADISEDDAKEKALASERVQKFIDGKEVRKAIFVKGKLVNVVV